jgi:hypothetical protein
MIGDVASLQGPVSKGKHIALYRAKTRHTDGDLVFLGSCARAMIPRVLSSGWHCQVDGSGVFGPSVRGWRILGSWPPHRRCTEVTGSRWRSLVTACGCITGSR